MIKDSLIFYSYKAVSFLLKLMPQFCIDLMANCLAKVVYIVDKKHRKIVFRNLEFFMPDLMEDHTKLAKNIYKRFARYLLDAVKGEVRTKSELGAIVSEHNPEIFQKFIDEKQKFIAVTGHFGHWELIPQYFSAHYKTFVGIGKRFGDSQKLTDELFEYRRKQGIEILPKRGAMREFVKAIKEDKLLGFLPDQSSSFGSTVEFFGKKIVWLDTASRIAKQFDIPVFPIYIVSDDMKNHRLIFFDPMFPDSTLEKEEDIVRLSQHQASSLEQIIKDYPDSYFWFHKRAKREYPEVYN